MANRLRLVQFIPEIWPTFRPDVAVLFGKYLSRHEIDVDLVAVLDPDADPAEQSWPAGRLYPIHASGGKILRHFGEFIGSLKALWSLDRGRLNAIQVRDMPLFAVFAGWRARCIGVPFFYWMSFPMPEIALHLAQRQGRSLGLLRYLFLMFRGLTGQFLLYHCVLRNADHVFVQSDRMLEDVAAKGIDRARMTPVPMCVDPERFAGPSVAPPAEIAELTAGRRVIGYLGACDRIRRIDFLFEVVGRLKTQVPDVLLLIVGDATEDNDHVWLKQRLVELGVEDHVHFTGWQPSHIAQSMLTLSEVALALMAPDPILDSTTPTKLVEYLALGLPVVANEHPDQSRVIGESGAGLCAQFEPSAYADAVARLLSDDTLREAMSEAGPRYVLANRSYPSMTARLAERYRALVSVHSGYRR